MNDIIGIVKRGGVGVTAHITGNNSSSGVCKPDSQSNRFRRFVINPPTLEYVVNHNMQTTQFLESIKDQNGSKIFARVDILDENNFLIKFTAATVGFVDVLFGEE